MIPKDGNILDIGSNIGITAVPLAKRASSGRVFCFEPIPNHIKAFREIVKYYQLPNIEIFATALGEKNGELTMVMPEYYKVKFQGFSHVAEKEDDKKKGELFPVPVRRLDDICTIRDLPQIHAIKIDVENYEYPVLKGAEAIIRRHRPIIFCELWDNEKRLQTLNYLKNNFGYEVRIFESDKLVEFHDQQVNNFLFIQGG
jgi:FkbM family methyltransferase